MGIGRQFFRVLATFEAAATTATYTVQTLKEDGSVDRQLTGLAEFRQPTAAMLSLGVPSGVGATVDKVRLQACFAPRESSPTWYDVLDEDGTVMEIPNDDASKTIQDVKGDALPVDADVATMPYLRLVCVDDGGSAVAPGAVTFEIGVKA
jgi:hypothetical protein